MTRPALRTTLAGLALPLAMALLSVPAMAETLSADVSMTVNSGRAAVDAFAVAIDANRDGRISPVEMDTAGRAIFASMDVDGDGLLTRGEMTGWEHGAARLAEFRGRTEAYDAAIGMVFDLFDRDHSGGVDAAEHAKAMRDGWALADRDGDGVMSLNEFREGFVVTAAMRTGLTG